MSDHVRDFWQAMRGHGLAPNDPPIDDSQLQRFRVEGDKSGSKNGWYVLHSNGLPAGSFGSWKTDQDVKWCSKSDNQMTSQERAAHQKRMANDTKKRDAEQKKRWDVSAKSALDEWNKASEQESQNHPYLKAKGVKAYGLRQHNNSLLVPLRDVSGRLHSLQYINQDGTKRFKRNGKIKGNFHTIGEVTDTIYLCEGYSTGASVHEASQCFVVVAFNAGNLKQVAETIKKKYPDNTLVIAADNDHQNEKNIGLEKAQKAAKSLGVPYVFPPFDQGQDGSDFNDYATIQGLEATREALTFTEEEESIEHTLEKIGELIERTREDVGAPFEPESIDLLRALREDSSADWQRVRRQLKQANRALLLTDLEKEIRGNYEGSQEPDSISDILTSIAFDDCELFHDADKEPYATFIRDGHKETWGVWSKGFGEWLNWRCYQDQNKAPRKASLDDALGTIAGKAKFDGEEREVAFRVGQRGNTYYLDLADEQWRSIEITPKGWRIIDQCPIAFVRTSTMRPIAEPITAGNLNLLWNFANIPEQQRLLVLTWLLECFRPDTPYAVLELIGEQGSAKSSTQSVLRDLIDPNEVNLRGAPKNSEDIFIAAKNNHLVSFENLSHLTPANQDVLCVLATGGGFATRTLYTNAEETVVKVKRPVVLNGISAVVVAQDLLSRAINIVTPEVTYRDAVQLKDELEQCRPSLIGGLLDLLVNTLAELPNVDIPAKQLPRMADMAMLGEALARSLGHAPGTYLESYNASHVEAVHRTIDSSPVAAAVITYMEKNPAGFNGLTKTLFENLGFFKPDDSSGWPKSPKGFGDAMRRASKALKTLGVIVKMNEKRTKSGMVCTLKYDDTFFSGVGGILPKTSTPNTPSTPFFLNRSKNNQKGVLGELDALENQQIPPPPKKKEQPTSNVHHSDLLAEGEL